MKPLGWRDFTLIYVLPPLAGGSFTLFLSPGGRELE